MEFLFQNLFLYFSTWFGFGFGFDLGLGFTETFWFGFGFCQNRKSGFVRSLIKTFRVFQHLETILKCLKISFKKSHFTRIFSGIVNNAFSLKDNIVSLPSLE